MISSNTVRFNLTPLGKQNKERSDPHGYRESLLFRESTDCQSSSSLRCADDARHVNECHLFHLECLFSRYTPQYGHVDRTRLNVAVIRDHYGAGQFDWHGQRYLHLPSAGGEKI
ncbi:hypothetical protein D3C84_1001120 [compost metagenome]